MCGIAGFLGDFRVETLAYFADALATRGPNGHASWHDAETGIGLLHRRLSIIDLTSAATQPMHGVGMRYAVIFNGEIYNFKALQASIGAYAFNRNSDTAVLAPLYDLMGPPMLDAIEGMFAFAIWDRFERELWLCRDHAGIKPLYYTLSPRGFAFASELKALVHLDGVDLNPDAAALADYLTLLWSPGERTPVQGIRKLKPGHWLRAKRAANGRVDVQVTRWYRPPQAPLVNGIPRYDPGRTPEQLSALLDTVVLEQCVSDVPVGAFLSGGVDSSALVSSMMANAGNGSGAPPAMTYCIEIADRGMARDGFGEDVHFARILAERLKVKLTTITVSPGEILARLPGLARMLDEPTADLAPLLIEEVCAAARADGIPVLLSGTGGDDVMTGYRRHQAARMRQMLGVFRGPAAGLLGVVAGFGNGSTARRAERLRPLLQGDDEDLLVNAFMTNSMASAWHVLHDDLRETLADGWDNALTESRADSRGRNLVDRMLYQELHGFLPDHNLNYGDKASMACGIEVRVPLVDRRVLDFMAGVAPDRKMHRLREKSFFKASIERRVGSDIVNRTKTGLGAPVHAWLTGPGKDLMEEVLLDCGGSGWFDQKRVAALWRQTLEGRANGAYAALATAMCLWWQRSLAPAA